jgi:TIR domain
MIKKIFLSHSSDDKDFVEHLADSLEQRGVPVWYSGWEIRVGDSIVEKIDEALAQMAGLIVVLSHASVHSRWVREDLSAGLVRHLAEGEVGIFPVRVDDCEIPPLLRHRRYADFSQSTTGLDDLIEAILPAQKLIEKIKSIKAEYTKIIASLQETSKIKLNEKYFIDSPQHWESVGMNWEGWRSVFSRLDELLQEAVNIRFQIATRLDPEWIHRREGFFGKFEYLVEQGYPLQSPEWAFLVSMMNVSVHNAHMYMSHAQRALMYLEDAGRYGIDRGKEDLDLREALVKLRGVFDILAE